MKLEEIEIKNVTVDIHKREISVNDDLVVLRSPPDKEKCIFLAYLTAHTTVYPLMGNSINGFTWKWLEENCGDILELWGFSKKRALRVFWNQTFLRSKSWLPKGQRNFDDWLVKGEELLRKIFIAEPLTEEQRYEMQIKKNTNHMHLLPDVEIKIVPDVQDINTVLCKQIPFKDISIGTDNYNPGSSVSDMAVEFAGLYPDTRTAIQMIADEMPKVEEVAFVAYVGKLFADDLRMLKTDWKIKHLRFLLRDPDSIDPALPGEIPFDEEHISKRKGDFKVAVKDIQGQARHILGYSPEFKYYRGHPCLRGLLVKRQFEEPYSAGFMSIYRQRSPKNHIDYAARNSSVIKLSNDNDYERILLESFSAWFKFVWEKGSYEKRS
ncbi:MAG: hypothetical protein ABIG61_01735 [Planctomycetota bacterium]